MAEQSSKQTNYEEGLSDKPKLKIGQEFESIDEAYYFYNEVYAKVVGFSVRMGSSKKNKLTKEITWKQFLCSKQGEPDKTYEKAKRKNSSTLEERNCGIKRVGCKARLSIVLNKSKKKWCISDFEECHNHELTTPRRIHLLPSHRKLTKAKKCLMKKLSSVNVPTCQQFRIMETMAGGIQNVGCIARDLRNFERDQREEVKGYDAAMLLDYLDSEREKNPAFYFAVDTNEENMMTRCFWADSTSRKAYYFFNDVVVFDSTYNTNKYHMIFASITGVNHHGQTIVYGCGLLSDETTESFIWLLEQWLKAMPSGPPKVIITDQDAAIAKAITQVLPLTLHRYCIWHIMFKFSNKLGPVIARDYYGLFRASVYNSETIEEFEATWNNAVQQGNLESHIWLNTMYQLRSKWVPTFCNHIFHAGMQSSQRAESNHAFFKRFISSNNSLLDFVTRIERGLRHQRHEELICDHVDNNEIPRMRTYYPMEKQMREVYTKEIFLRFQDEVVKSTAYLKCDIIREDNNQCVYTILRAAIEEQSWKVRQIVYDKNSSFAKCSCGGFEVEGIVCRHIIFFFRSINIVHLPIEYILDRWTKSAKVGRVWDDDGIEVKEVGDKSLIMRHIQLSQLSQAVIDEASLSPETTDYLKEGLEKLRIGIKELCINLGVEEVPSTKRKPQQLIVKEPAQVKAKGSGKRLKSSKEEAIGKHKCGMCGKTGHNRTTCQQLGVGSSVPSNPADKSNVMSSI